MNHNTPCNEVRHISLGEISSLIRAIPDGWAVTPIGDNKAPFGRDWQNRPYSRDELLSDLEGGVYRKFENEPKSGMTKAIGVLCGTPSGGLLFIDHDGPSCDEFIESLTGLPLSEALPETVTVTSGRPGRYQLIYRVSEQFWEGIKTTKLKTGAISDEDGKAELLEFRWDNCQSVVVGMHPTTGRYRWVDGKSPSDLDAAPAPLWMIEQMLRDNESQNESHETKPYQPVEFEGGLTNEREWALDYLRCIPNQDLDWYSWRDVILALHKCGVSESEARSWSASSSKHTEKGFMDVWKYIDNKGTCLGIGTLGYLAKKNGWTKPATSGKSQGKTNKTQSKTQGGDFVMEDRPQTVAEIKKKKDPGEAMASQYEAFREHLMIVLAIPDDTEREFKINQLCSMFRLPKSFVDRTIAELKKRQKPQRQTRYKLSEILSLKREATRYLVDDWIPVGEAILISAVAKTGKSLLAYDACFAVASGGQFLGAQAKQGKVLIIQTEEGESEMQERLTGRGFDELDPESVEIWTDFKVHKSMPELEAWIAENRPSLVMVDSYRKIHAGSGIDEYKPEYATAAYEMSDMCRNVGASLIIVSHDKKQSKDSIGGIAEVAGSAALPGAVWGIWRITRAGESESDTTRFLHATLRGDNGGKHKIQLVEDEAGWHFKHVLEVGLAPEVKDYEKRILNVLHSQQDPIWRSCGDINEMIGQDRQSTSIYKSLNRLVKRGKLLRYKENGKRVIWYGLPEWEAEGDTPPPSQLQSASNPLPELTLPISGNGGGVITSDAHTATHACIRNKDQFISDSGMSPSSVSVNDARREISHEFSENQNQQGVGVERVSGLSATQGGGSVPQPMFIERNGVTEYNPKGNTSPNLRRRTNPFNEKHFDMGDEVQSRDFKRGIVTEFNPADGYYKIEGDAYSGWVHSSELRLVKKCAVNAIADAPTPPIQEHKGLAVGDRVQVTFENLDSTWKGNFRDYKVYENQVGTVTKFIADEIGLQYYGKTYYHPVVTFESGEVKKLSRDLLVKI